MQANEEGAEDCVVALNDLCRMCTRQCGDQDYSCLVSPGSPFAIRMHQYLGIQLETDDELLPKQICQNCCETLDHWRDVRESVRRTQEFYRRQLELRKSSPIEFRGLDSDPTYLVKTPKEELIDIDDENPTIITVSVNPDLVLDNEQDDEDESQDNIEQQIYGCSICHEKFNNYDYLMSHQSQHTLQETSSILKRKLTEHDLAIDPKLSKKTIKHVDSSLDELHNTDNNLRPILPKVTNNVSVALLPQTSNFASSNPQIMLVNTKQKNHEYPCGRCELGFDEFVDYAKHLQVHQIFKELPCGLCGCVFKKITLLLQHVQEHKNNPNKKVSFTCEICSTVYSCKKNLTGHIRYRHSNNYKSTNSEKYNLALNENSQTISLQEKNQQQKHLEPHTFHCGTCKQNFKGIVSFAQHFPLKHSKFYELFCGVCNARFKKLPLLLRHEQEHKTKPDKVITFPCKYCKYTFSEQRNLNNHVRFRHPGQPSPNTVVDVNMLLQFNAIKKNENVTLSSSIPTQISSSIPITQSYAVGLNIDQASTSMSENIKSQDSTYSCGLCKENFPHVVDFAKHFPLAHETYNELPCGVCDAKFKKLPLLLRHEQRHKTNSLKKVTFICNYCNKNFSANRNLKQHLIRYHSSEEHISVPNKAPNSSLYVCEHCPATFYELNYYNQHLLTHVPNRCPYCNGLFNSRELLSEHLLKVHSTDKNGVRKHPCPICGKFFKSQQTMKVHTELHSSERNYVCEICAKSYRSYSTLCKHKQSHSDKPRCKCDFCDRTFSFKTAMKKHIMLHIGYLPHKCKKCTKRFNGLHILKLHIIKKHSKGFPHFCVKCRKGFRDVRNWRRHMKIVCRVPIDEIPYTRDRQFIKHSVRS